MRRKNVEPVKERIRGLFFSQPTTSMHLRAIARSVDVSPSAAMDACDALIKEGLIEKKETPPTVSYTALHESEHFRAEKRAWNLLQVIRSGVVEHLAERTKPKAIILFGSFGKGEDWEKSDIDIALIEPRHLTSVAAFEEKLGKGIQLLDVKKPTKDLANNLVNGVVLYGRWDPL